MASPNREAKSGSYPILLFPYGSHTIPLHRWPVLPGSPRSGVAVAG